MESIRQSVRGYLDDNVGWRAEDRDLVWGYRFVIAKMALLAGQQMLFKELVSLIQETLNETASDLLKFLTPTLIAARILGISPDEIQMEAPPANPDDAAPAVEDRASPAGCDEAAAPLCSDSSPETHPGC